LSKKTEMCKESDCGWRASVSSSEFSSFQMDVQSEATKTQASSEKCEENYTLNYDQNAGSEPYKTLIPWEKSNM